MALGGGKIAWVGRGISILVSLPFLMSGFMKLKGGAEMATMFGKLGLPESMILPLGILELSCVLIYLIPRTSILGAILLTGYLGGAICTHWRVGQLFALQSVLGVLVWLGLYLRDRRLMALIPLRTPPKEA